MHGTWRVTTLHGKGRHKPRCHCKDVRPAIKNTLNAIAVYVFQKMLHGFIGLTDIVLKRKLRLAGQTVHVHFMAGTGYV